MTQPRNGITARTNLKHKYGSARRLVSTPRSRPALELEPLLTRRCSRDPGSRYLGGHQGERTLREGVGKFHLS